MTEEQAKGNAGASEQHSLGADQGSDSTAKGTKATQNGDIAAPTFGGLIIATHFLFALAQCTPM